MPTVDDSFSKLGERLVTGLGNPGTPMCLLAGRYDKTTPRGGHTLPTGLIIENILTLVEFRVFSQRFRNSVSNVYRVNGRCRKPFMWSWRQHVAAWVESTHCLCESCTHLRAAGTRCLLPRWTKHVWRMQWRVKLCPPATLWLYLFWFVVETCNLTAWRFERRTNIIYPQASIRKSGTLTTPTKRRWLDSDSYPCSRHYDA